MLAVSFYFANTLYGKTAVCFNYTYVCFVFIYKHQAWRYIFSSLSLALLPCLSASLLCSVNPVSNIMMKLRLQYMRIWASIFFFLFAETISKCGVLWCYLSISLQFENGRQCKHVFRNFRRVFLIYSFVFLLFFNLKWVNFRYYF